MSFLDLFGEKGKVTKCERSFDFVKERDKA